MIKRVQNKAGNSARAPGFASRGSRTPTDWMETSHSTAKLSTPGSWLQNFKNCNMELLPSGFRTCPGICCLLPSLDVIFVTFWSISSTICNSLWDSRATAWFWLCIFIDGKLQELQYAHYMHWLAHPILLPFLIDMTWNPSNTSPPHRHKFYLVQKPFLQFPFILTKCLEFTSQSICI